ncbi:MAG: crossover junction endodeoxyribonuclease RuvC [Microthrixaceae bacterium]|nr:crossover junction endodeoxyribonuclease RuvC [Microthrixaceae bacterium]
MHPTATNVEPVFVLGVDPGLTRCGYCVLRVSARQNRVVSMGLIRTDKDNPVAHRLTELWTDIAGIFEEYPIGALAIERVLFQTNVRTAIGVAQASGVVMTQAALRGIPVTEYSPNQIKDAVAGDGAADKQQIQEMVQILLGLKEAPKPADVADAVAIALTHAAYNPVVDARRTNRIQISVDSQDSANMVLAASGTEPEGHR